MYKSFVCCDSAAQNSTTIMMRPSSSLSATLQVLPVRPSVVRLSVSHGLFNLRTKMCRKTEIVVNVSQGRSNRCASGQLAGSKVKVIGCHVICVYWVEMRTVL